MHSRNQCCEYPITEERTHSIASQGTKKPCLYRQRRWPRKSRSSFYARTIGVVNLVNREVLTVSLQWNGYLFSVCRHFLLEVTITKATYLASRSHPTTGGWRSHMIFQLRGFNYPKAAQYAAGKSAVLSLKIILWLMEMRETSMPVMFEKQERYWQIFPIANNLTAWHDGDQLVLTVAA